MKSCDETSSPVAEPAIDALLEAFSTHALVGIGDWYGLAQQAAFYVDLVSDPRFVRNVVVEFGGAAAQPIVDRFVDGEAVPYQELLMLGRKRTRNSGNAGAAREYTQGATVPQFIRRYSE